MKLKKYLLVATLLLPIMANAACNCDQDEEDDDGSYRPYRYIGLKGGTNHVANQNFMVGGTNSYGIYVGKRYTQLFAVEFEYSYLGTFSSPAGAGHYQAASIAGVHHVSIGRGELVGKLGLAHTHTNLNGASSNQVDLTYGIGWQFSLNRDLDVRFSGDRYQVSIPGASKNTASVAHVGIAYRY